MKYHLPFSFINIGQRARKCHTNPSSLLYNSLLYIMQQRGVTTRSFTVFRNIIFTSLCRNSTDASRLSGGCLGISVAGDPSGETNCTIEMQKLN